MQPLKRSIAAVLLIAMILSMLPEAMAATTYTGTINTDKVFFRINASTSSVYYCQLSKGTKVTVSGVKGDFYKVTYNKNTGYVMKKYVSEKQEETDAGSEDRDAVH